MNTYQQTREVVATITHGRAALANNDELREAWAKLLEAITNTPLPDRVAFHRYVRLVHGTTAGLTIPQVISEDEVDKVREALADFRGRARVVALEDIDVDEDRTMQVDDRILALELASDRPDRG